MKISAESFVKNAAQYIDIFRLWLTWKGAPPFVQSAVAILEKVLEFPMAQDLLISALRNVPGFEGSGSPPAGTLPDGLESFSGMEADIYQVSKNLIEPQ